MICHNLKIISLDQCDSTNNYLRTHFEKLKAKLPVLVTTASQTSGRGRENRTWISLRGKGLYSSFGFLLDSNKNLHLLPLISGISVIETLKMISSIEFVLKWPNDILYKCKKIAGILIENITFENRVFCITGIGINLNHTSSNFNNELVQRAVSLKMITGLTYKAETVNMLLSEIFFNWLEKLKNNESNKIIHTANRFTRYLENRVISFHHPSNNKIIRGIFKGINHDGGLILGNKKGTSTIYYSGEII